MGTAEPVRPKLGVAIWADVTARGGVGALGGITAWGGVGALGGIGARGDVRALCRCVSGISSSSSSSSVKLAMTLRHFWLLSLSSMIKGPPVPRGSVDFLFWEGPSAAECFPVAFLITRGSRTSTPAGQSVAGTSEMYTAARSWPWMLQRSD
jgi:hypothetical protein